ncbi:hypothetical protein N9W11_07745 [Psychrosphaera haliotis]|nr:hypothetical protein [Psychrosphaera haliotis]
MQHDKKSQALEALFVAWSNGETLSPLEFERLNSSAEYKEKIELINALSASGRAFDESIEVPSWDRASTFSGHNFEDSSKGVFSWWPQGMSAFAMSVSLVICTMFVFDLKLQWQEGSVKLLTATEQKQQWQQEQTQKLQQQMNTLINENRAQLTLAIKQLDANQTESTVSLANYLIESGRTERQEDLEHVVSIIQKQRAEDLMFFQSEIDELQYKLKVASLRRGNATTRDEQVAGAEE